uniref:Uncharacterized protein n=1 Tax=Sorghum bicolor TaxID=4558 RepID=Q9XEP9_SORBI|nr:hypothetical protein [Sorghum bicolor]
MAGLLTERSGGPSPEAWAGALGFRGDLILLIFALAFDIPPLSKLSTDLCHIQMVRIDSSSTALTASTKASGRDENASGIRSFFFWELLLKPQSPLDAIVESGILRKLRLAGFPSATTAAAVYLGYRWWPRCAGAPAICCTSQQTTMRILQPCSPPTFECSYPSPTCSRGSPPDLHLAAMSTGLLELTLSPAIDHDEGDAFGSPSPHKDSGLRPLPLRRRIGLHLEGCGSSRDIFVLSAVGTAVSEGGLYLVAASSHRQQHQLYPVKMEDPVDATSVSEEQEYATQSPYNLAINSEWALLAQKFTKNLARSLLYSGIGRATAPVLCKNQLSLDGSDYSQIRQPLEYRTIVSRTIAGTDACDILVQLSNTLAEESDPQY